MEKLSKLQRMQWLKTAPQPTRFESREFYCRFEEDNINKGMGRNRNRNRGNNKSQKDPQVLVPEMEGRQASPSKRSQHKGRQKNPIQNDPQRELLTDKEFEEATEKAIAESMKLCYNNAHETSETNPDYDYWGNNHHHNLPVEQVSSDGNNNASKNSIHSTIEHTVRRFEKQGDNFHAEATSSAIKDPAIISKEVGHIDNLNRINGLNETHTFLGQGARKKESTLIGQQRQRYYEPENHEQQRWNYSNQGHSIGRSSSVYHPDRPVLNKKPFQNDKYHWTKSQYDNAQPSTSRHNQQECEFVNSKTQNYSPREDEQVPGTSRKKVAQNQNISILKKSPMNEESTNLVAKTEKLHIGDFNSSLNRVVKDSPPMPQMFYNYQQHVSYDMAINAQDDQFYDAVSDPTLFSSIPNYQSSAPNQNFHEEPDLSEVYKTLSIHDPSLFKLLVQTNRIKISRPM